MKNQTKLFVRNCHEKDIVGKEDKMNSTVRMIKWSGAILVLAVLFLGQVGAAYAQQQECILQSSTGPGDYYPMGGQEAPTGRNTVCVPFQAESGLEVMTGFDPAEYYPIYGPEVPTARNVEAEAIWAMQQSTARGWQEAPSQAAAPVQPPASLPQTGLNQEGSSVAWLGGIAAAVLVFAGVWLVVRRSVQAH
jgi:LPXTG-motif cell wall-anchored protein